ncbi:TRAP transporter large permease, partial [Kordiimonas sp.]|uniref:TRAP transporter large permease n=1 Tax=Kordiimonas sp. TaxID=1970157 RepID=UPI003A91C0C0
GGLALVNVISNSLFGSISGSSVAATSAIGSFMVPEMEKQGYPRSFSAALTASASITGLLIPPSNILIIYAVASGGVSISALFVAGYIPGIAVMIGLMIVSFFYARKSKDILLNPAMEKGTLLQKTWDAFPSLFLIFLIIGGILAGIYTATEAGAIAVAYAFVLSTFVYKELSLEDLPSVLVKGVKTTAMVMFLIGTSMAMSWVLAYENVPTSVAETLLSITDNPILLLLIINITLLIVGAFLDITPAVLIFTPIFLPVAVSLGMSPLQFGIMLVLNLSIGLCTPPVGSVLFVACAVARTKITDLIKPLLPMYGAMIAALLLVTYVAGVSEFLPRLFGLIE